MTGDHSGSATRNLVRAILLDGLCIGTGVAGFMMTDNWVWLAGGALLGIGFSAPALIAHLRARR